MNHQRFLWHNGAMARLGIFSILFLFALVGCTAQEPPLSPGAAAFKKEVKDYLDRLSGPLVEPILQRNVKAINATLQKIEPEAVKLCRMCPFTMGVIDGNGNTLTVYPYKKETKGDFSQYQVVAQTLIDRKIGQQRFFLQDNSEVYLICAPIMRGEEFIGILVLSLSAEEAQRRWGIKEKEFLSIAFNR